MAETPEAAAARARMEAHIATMRGGTAPETPVVAAPAALAATPVQTPSIRPAVAPPAKDPAITGPSTGPQQGSTRAEWEQFLDSEEGRAAVLQFGVKMLTPPSVVGQGPLPQLASAVGEGGQAAGRVAATKQAAAEKKREQDIIQRGQDVAAATAERGQDVTRRGQDMDLKIAKGSLTGAMERLREELAAGKELNDATIEAAAERAIGQWIHETGMKIYDREAVTQDLIKTLQSNKEINAAQITGRMEVARAQVTAQVNKAGQVLNASLMTNAVDIVAAELEQEGLITDPNDFPDDDEVAIRVVETYNRLLEAQGGTPITSPLADRAAARELSDALDWITLKAGAEAGDRDDQKELRRWAGQAAEMDALVARLIEEGKITPEGGRPPPGDGAPPPGDGGPAETPDGAALTIEDEIKQIRTQATTQADLNVRTTRPSAGAVSSTLGRDLFATSYENAIDEMAERRGISVFEARTKAGIKVEDLEAATRALADSLNRQATSLTGTAMSKENLQAEIMRIRGEEANKIATFYGVDVEFVESLIDNARAEAAQAPDMAALQ